MGIFRFNNVFNCNSLTNPVGEHSLAGFFEINLTNSLILQSFLLAKRNLFCIIKVKESQKGGEFVCNRQICRILLKNI